MDLALALDAVQGPDPADPFCAERVPEKVVPTLDRGVDDLRIAVLGGCFECGAVVEADEAVDSAAALHLQWLRTRVRDCDPAVRDRLIAGVLISVPLVQCAQKIRRWVRDQVMEVSERHDLLIAPATPCVAPMLGQKTLVLGKEQVPLRPNIGIYIRNRSLLWAACRCHANSPDNWVTDRCAVDRGAIGGTTSRYARRTCWNNAE
jgi:1-carboxybiuret hydrolase